MSEHAIMTEQQAAEALGVKLAELRAMARTWSSGEPGAKGPRPLKIGSRTHYSRDAVEDWLEEQTCPSE